MAPTIFLIERILDFKLYDILDFDKQILLLFAFQYYLLQLLPLMESFQNILFVMGDINTFTY